MAMWRVFWVPQDAVRSGVRRRLLAGWEDLPAREDDAGVRAGDVIFLSPDHRVDPLLGLYGQSGRFRRYTAETRRNYATDIAVLLTFLWGRGKAWTEAVQRDLEDYEHWRRFVCHGAMRPRCARNQAPGKRIAIAPLRSWCAASGRLGSIACWRSTC